MAASGLLIATLSTPRYRLSKQQLDSKREREGDTKRSVDTRSFARGTEAVQEGARGWLCRVAGPGSEFGSWLGEICGEEWWEEVAEVRAAMGGFVFYGVGWIQGSDLWVSASGRANIRDLWCFMVFYGVGLCFVVEGCTWA